MPNSRIETERLSLIPYTLDLVRLTLQGRQSLAEALALAVPPEWPGPDLEEILLLVESAMLELPARQRWNWIVAHRADRTLIGSAGFKDLPDLQGQVELGYGLIPAYHGHGYATEATRALVAHALAHPGVARVFAECEDTNYPSQRVLARLGMARVGRDGTLLQYALERPDLAHALERSDLPRSGWPPRC